MPASTASASWLLPREVRHDLSKGPAPLVSPGRRAVEACIEFMCEEDYQPGTLSRKPNTLRIRPFAISTTSKPTTTGSGAPSGAACQVNRA